MAYDEAYASQSGDPNVIEVVQVFNDATLEECMRRTSQMLADLAVTGIGGLPGALEQIGATAAAAARRSSRRYVLFLG